MQADAPIVLFGTGSFAARILFDLAATARAPVAVTLVGRDEQKLEWMRTAALARADMFGVRAKVDTRRLDAFDPVELQALLAAARPRLVVNTASVQRGRIVTDRPDGWTRLVQEAGLGMTVLLQARLSLDIARAAAAAVPGAHFVNCCYPDVVNPVLAAAGAPVRCGIGNAAILAHAFAGLLGPGHPRLRLLAQHAALSAFRRPAAERKGKAPMRLWIGEEEVDDVYPRFARVKLSAEPVIDISGASGVPLLVALATGADWRGHAPGPNGLPGGYPLQLRDGQLDLDLPAGLDRSQAVAWNAAFEEANGVVVGADGRVRYTGRVEAVLRRASPDLAAGFRVAEFDAAYGALLGLRAALMAAG